MGHALPKRTLLVMKGSQQESPIEGATGDKRRNTVISNDATVKILFLNTNPVVTEIHRKAKQASLNTPKIFFSPQESGFYIF